MGYRERYLAPANAWVGAKRGDKAYTDMLNCFNTNPKGIKADSEDCSEFTVACAIKAFGKNQHFIPIASTANAQSKLWPEGLSDTPRPASIVYFDYRDGLGISHAEIVEDVYGGIIYTINGNFNHKVVKMNRKLNYRYIAGYGIPDWPKEKEDMNAWQTAAIKQIVLKYGSVGPLVLWLQKYLQSKGYYLMGDRDSKWLEYMDKEFERFQRDNGLYVDRICGVNCWKFILK
jgi:hypothetical protein